MINTTSRLTNESVRDYLNEKAYAIFENRDIISAFPEFCAVIKVNLPATPAGFRELEHAVIWDQDVPFLTGGNVVVARENRNLRFGAGWINEYGSGKKSFPAGARIIEVRAWMPYELNDEQLDKMRKYVQASGKPSASTIKTLEVFNPE